MPRRTRVGDGAAVVAWRGDGDQVRLAPRRRRLAGAGAADGARRRAGAPLAAVDEAGLLTVAY